jgi:uncharacterized protein (UPF0332 family)
MKEHDLRLLLKDNNLIDDKIKDFISKGILLKQNPDQNEIEGHFEKAQHNLRFVHENIKLGFLDWAITGCYYASYHSALALIMTRGFSSKNHLATLCILIKYFYKNDISTEDLKMLSELFDYQDVLFYVQSKNRREDASYSSKTKFTRQEVEQLKIKASLFVSKIGTIIQSR